MGRPRKYPIEENSQKPKNYYTITKLKMESNDSWPGYQLECVTVQGDKVVGKSVLKTKDTMQMVSALGFEHMMSDIQSDEDDETNLSLS